DERLILPGFDPANTQAWHLFVVRVRRGAGVTARDDVIRKLAERGIGTSVHFIPVHTFSAYQKLGRWKLGQFPVAEAASAAAISLVPSLGRGADDFADLGQRLAAAGFFALCPNPRGVAGSTGPLEPTNLYDWARDVAVVVSQLPGGSAHVVGHAWGNLVARAM